MTLRTPEESATTLCPLARTFAEATAVATCRGPACAVWRWERVTVDHPLWRGAVKAKAEALGEKPPYAKAAAWVAENKVQLGLVPGRGFCGVGGVPL